MIGHRIGYIRVSTFDQNPERQLDNVKVDRTFIDKASGKDTKRPELDALMKFTRMGDTPWLCIAWIGWHAILMICAVSYSC